MHIPKHILTNAFVHKQLLEMLFMLNQFSKFLKNMTYTNVLMSNIATDGEFDH